MARLGTEQGQEQVGWFCSVAVLLHASAAPDA